MRISFVIPAYNEEKLLPQCIDSVLRELARGTYDSEIIVVDNASNDRTSEVAIEYREVRVVREERKGLTYARQAGFTASTGDVIANIDADTMLTPDWIRTVFATFERDDRIVALSGPYIYYDLSSFDRFLVKGFYFGGYLAHLLNQYVLHTGAMLQGGNFVLRRDALEKIGGFDTSIAFYGEDTDIARRISKTGKVVWTFKLPMYTSGRRLKKEGVVRTGWTYAINFFSTTFFHSPTTQEYSDIRE